MKIIVGLGNPGKQYKFHRHNLGFMLIDSLTDQDQFQNKYKSKIQKTNLDKQTVLLVKPQTFMNLSGQAIAEITHFYKTPLEDLLVIQDDKDLPFGQMKFQKSRGHGGHNGIANIHQELGTSDYCRLKMGVATVIEDESESSLQITKIEDTRDFVLSPFEGEELKKLPDFLQQGIRAVCCFVQQNYEKAANQFNYKGR